MPPTKTKATGVLELFADLDTQDANVCRRQRAIDEQVGAIIGQRRADGKRAGGLLADLASRRSDAIGAAARHGDTADTSAIDDEALVAEARVAELDVERRALTTARDRIATERRAVLVEHHGELVERLAGIVAEGNDLIAAAAAAAQAALAHRANVRAALGLAVVALDDYGVPPGTRHDDRKRFAERWRPWAGSNTVSQAAFWSALEGVARGGRPAPSPAPLDASRWNRRAVAAPEQPTGDSERERHIAAAIAATDGGE